MAEQSVTNPTSGPIETGRLVKWNDEKGYGFIQPADGSPDVFVHVSGLLGGTRRPKEGDEVRYEMDRSQRRAKAVNVRVKALPLPNTVPLAYAVGTFCLGLYLLYAFRILDARAPVLGYMTMSVITFGFFYVDKKRAEEDRWRLTETSMHVLEILGGWPGSIVALGMLRHKTRKAEYLAMLCVIIAVHVLTWILLAALD